MTEHDPLDEVLARGNTPSADALRAIRARYAAQPAPPVSPRLAEYTDVDPTIELTVLPAAAPSGDDTRPMPLVPARPSWSSTMRTRSHHTMRLISAFLATAVGKVVLGITVAAAGLAGAHAAGVIDIVPGPTDTDVTVDDQGDDVDQGEDADDQGEDADEDEDADDQGEDVDDQGEDVDESLGVADEGDDVDDQGEEVEDQGDDDQGEDVDDEGEDLDDEGDEIDDDEGDEADEDEAHEDEADADELGEDD